VGAEIVDALAPQEATSSSKASAACAASLAPTSTSSCAAWRQNIALGGFLTNCCVESTMRRLREGYESSPSPIARRR